MTQNIMYRKQIRDRIEFCYPSLSDKKTAYEVKSRVFSRLLALAAIRGEQFFNEELATEIDILEQILGIKEVKPKKKIDVDMPPKEI